VRGIKECLTIIGWVTESKGFGEMQKAPFYPVKNALNSFVESVKKASQRINAG